MKDNVYFDAFADWVCSWCVNRNSDCEPLDNCDWEEQFEEAQHLCDKLKNIEEDPDCIFGTSEEDYDFDAQSNAYNAVDSELERLQKALIHDVQINMKDYYRGFAYEH